MASFFKYERIPKSDIESKPDPFDTNVPTQSHRRSWVIVLVLLIASNLCTWQVSKIRTTKALGEVHDARSPYASLARDQPRLVQSQNAYNQDDETLRDIAWEAINIDAGMIAVPASFVAQHKLPETQEFVWDKDKRLYLLNGYHSLHCARAIYISLMEFRRGQPQSRAWGHTIHCIDQLRQEALCNADDTPRYTTSDAIPRSGMGQMRMCRNWDQLEQWATGYNACYRFINQTASVADFPVIQRYVWCPKDSPYLPAVEKVFGHIEWSEDGYTISEPTPSG